MKEELDFFKKERIKELVALLNEASEAYYNGHNEILSSYEWDKMFDELVRLETETGYYMVNSPTKKTGCIEHSKKKEYHEFPALSLAKSKNISDLQKWTGDKIVWLSWKLDGLTLVLTYDNGTLTKIMTRGNGEIGTNITFMKNSISGFPINISYMGHIVVRGEAVISYDDFDRINNNNLTIKTIDDKKYTNPRNLAAGTLNRDDLEIIKERNVKFIAFSLVFVESDMPYWGDRIKYLSHLGFEVVEHEITNADKLPDIIDRWTKIVESSKMNIPVDGLVICYDDFEYSLTGSITGHHATNAGYAFKWADTIVDTELEYIEWSCTPSTIVPVAVFKPVVLEGCTIKRASLYNISELERLKIGGPGTVCSIIRSNKIIPKIVSIKEKIGNYEIPELCPICNSKTEIVISKKSNIKTLWCTNPNCSSKQK